VGTDVIVSRLVKNSVFLQPVCGIGTCRHFRRLQVVENEASRKSHFRRSAVKKRMNALFHHPVRGDILRTVEAPQGHLGPSGERLLENTEGAATLFAKRALGGLRGSIARRRISAPDDVFAFERHRSEKGGAGDLSTIAAVAVGHAKGRRLRTVAHRTAKTSAGPGHSDLRIRPLAS